MDIQKSILVVEGDRDLALLISRSLSGSTYQLHHVVNGLDAVKFIQKKNLI